MSPTTGAVANLSALLDPSSAGLASVVANSRHLFVTGGIEGMTGVLDDYLVPG